MTRTFGSVSNALLDGIVGNTKSSSRSSFVSEYVVDGAGLLEGPDDRVATIFRDEPQILNSVSLSNVSEGLGELLRSKFKGKKNSVDKSIWSHALTHCIRSKAKKVKCQWVNELLDHLTNKGRNQISRWAPGCRL